MVEVPQQADQISVINPEKLVAYFKKMADTKVWIFIKNLPANNIKHIFNLLQYENASFLGKYIKDLHEEDSSNLASILTPEQQLKFNDSIPFIWFGLLIISLSAEQLKTLVQMIPDEILWNFVKSLYATELIDFSKWLTTEQQEKIQNMYNCALSDDPSWVIKDKTWQKISLVLSDEEIANLEDEFAQFALNNPPQELLTSLTALWRKINKLYTQ